MPAVAPPAPTRTRSSRHELEPNPFEHSFRSPTEEGGATGSNSSAAGTASPARSKRAPAKTRASARNVGSATSGGSAEANNVEGETKGSKKAPAAAAPATPSAAASAAGNGNAKTGAAATSGHTLPGVASLTSPADGNNPFNWATGSLRTGPLSPAMLGGPSGSHFDPNTFRTGFTPDLSNFKTGLTPLGATGINFPPPSPNTAAFLATIGASSAGMSAPGSAAPITPNTLAALTGNAAGLADTTAPGGAHRADGAPQPFDFAFSRSMTDKPTSRLRSSTGHEDEANQSVSPEMINNKPLAGDARGNGALGHRPDGSLMQPPRQPVSQQHQQQHGPGPQGDHSAASGLFLLSQAHQELSKREDADAAAAAHALTGIPRAGGNANGIPMFTNGAPPPGAPAPNYKVTQGPPPKPAAAAAAPKKTAGTKRKKGAKDADENKGPAASAAAPAPPAAVPANATSPANDKPAKGGRKGAKKAKVDQQQMFANSPAANGASGKMFDSDDEDDGGSKHDDDDGEGDDDEKRKNFLERNRQAALKCRQRKKAWLQSLQAKVEYLQQDNENLQNTVGALRNEVVYLKTQLMHANAQLLTAASANQAGAGGPPPPPAAPHPNSSANDAARQQAGGAPGMPPPQPPTFEQIPVSRGPN